MKPAFLYLEGASEYRLHAISEDKDYCLTFSIQRLPFAPKALCEMPPTRGGIPYFHLYLFRAAAVLPWGHRSSRETGLFCLILPLTPTPPTFWFFSQDRARYQFSVGCFCISPGCWSYASTSISWVMAREPLWGSGVTPRSLHMSG